MLLFFEIILGFLEADPLTVLNLKVAMPKPLNSDPYIQLKRS